MRRSAVPYRHSPDETQGHGFLPAPGMENHIIASDSELSGCGDPEVGSSPSGDGLSYWNQGDSDGGGTGRDTNPGDPLLLFEEEEELLYRNTSWLSVLEEAILLTSATTTEEYNNIIGLLELQKDSS